ncbi:unnamed protein product [Adineta ricciae]|uniref:Uncharacterized protein n=1 Tax=Adineta ricciae TaxID=249248 RepID=A0A815NIZ0_ADIRI|nr:unnamed protein product [Adineta ricciae]
MYSFRQQVFTFFCALFLLISTVHSFRISELDRVIDEKNLGNEQPAHRARFQNIGQMLARRALYDPAFGDSWSNYLEKKRSLFDPAYGEWANTFKRSDE